MFRLELTLGPGLSNAEFGLFLESLGEVSHAGRIAASTVQLDRWQPEIQPGRAVTWRREYSAQDWATGGTALFLALQALAHQPYAAAWQMLGAAATHPDVGLRLVQVRTDGQVELYRIP